MADSENDLYRYHVINILNEIFLYFNVFVILCAFVILLLLFRFSVLF